MTRCRYPRAARCRSRKTVPRRMLIKPASAVPRPATPRRTRANGEDREVVVVLAGTTWAEAWVMADMVALPVPTGGLRSVRCR